MLTRLSTHHYNTRRSSLASATSDTVDHVDPPVSIPPSRPRRSRLRSNTPDPNDPSNSKRASADVEDETFKSEEDQVAASSDKTASGSRRKVDSPEGAKSSKRRKVDSPKRTIAQTRKATESQSSKLSIHVPASGPALEAAHELQTRYWIAQGSPLFPIDYSKASQWDRDMVRHVGAMIAADLEARQDRGTEKRAGNPHR